MTAYLLTNPAELKERAIDYIVRRPHGEYTAYDVRVIVSHIWGVANAVGVDALVCVAMLIHETGNLTSALSQRTDKDGNNLRNPGGIGVTGAHRPDPAPGYVWDADRNCYRAACGFATWLDSAHALVGRLMAYASDAAARNDAQAVLVQTALKVRPLPVGFEGSATSVQGLQGKWAVPGTKYAEAIERIMQAIRGD